jgi:hypothetical protein
MREIRHQVSDGRTSSYPSRFRTWTLLIQKPSGYTGILAKHGDSSGDMLQDAALQCGDAAKRKRMPVRFPVLSWGRAEPSNALVLALQ